MEMVRPEGVSEKDFLRFASKVVELECWQWTGCIDQNGKGYGCIKFNRKMKKAHRIAYEWWIGPIPEGLFLDHICKNRWCVNPEHLEPVTQWQNVVPRGTTGITAQNARKTECPNGHGYDYIASNGGRRCRECSNAANRASRLKKKLANSST